MIAREHDTMGGSVGQILGLSMRECWDTQRVVCHYLSELRDEPDGIRPILEALGLGDRVYRASARREREQRDRDG